MVDKASAPQHDEPASPQLPTMLPPEMPAGTRDRLRALARLRRSSSRLRRSLLVSTYQAGKLGVVGTDAGRLTLAFHNFERAMGVAVRPDRLAVGARARSGSSRAPTSPRGWSPPAGTTPASWPVPPTSRRDPGPRAGVGRTSELWCVNTLFNCLCTLDERYSFVPRWRPPFVTALAAEDRCHLNGLAMGGDGGPAYVTVIAQTDTPQGWRATSWTAGCDPRARQRDGPPRPVHAALAAVHGGKLWVLDSGRGLVVAET